MEIYRGKGLEVLDLGLRLVEDMLLFMFQLNLNGNQQKHLPALLHQKTKTLSLEQDEHCGIPILWNWHHFQKSLIYAIWFSVAQRVKQTEVPDSSLHQRRALLLKVIWLSAQGTVGLQGMTPPECSPCGPILEYQSEDVWCSSSSSRWEM